MNWKMIVYVNMPFQSAVLFLPRFYSVLSLADIKAVAENWKHILFTCEINSGLPSKQLHRIFNSNLRSISFRICFQKKKKMFLIAVLCLFLASCMHILAKPLPQFLYPAPIICGPCYPAYSYPANSNVEPINRPADTYHLFVPAYLPAENGPAKSDKLKSRKNQLEHELDDLENTARSRIQYMSTNETDFKRLMKDYTNRFDDKNTVWISSQANTKSEWMQLLSISSDSKL